MKTLLISVLLLAGCAPASPRVAHAVPHPKPTPQTNCIGHGRAIHAETVWYSKPDDDDLLFAPAHLANIITCADGTTAVQK